MKNHIKNISYIIAMGCITIFAPSCVNDLNVTPINPKVTQTFNQDEVFAKAYAGFALTGQEGPAGNIDIDTEITDEGRSALYRCLWNSNELTTDEAICAWGDAEVVELNTNSWSSRNTTSGSIYDRMYFVISISNHFLEQTAGKTDAATVKQRAEIRFLRALSYYYLLDLFGNVPFTEKVSLVPPKQIKRAALFAYIEKELSECEADMYEPRTAPYYRVDKAANWLLRSRLYLNAVVYTSAPETKTTPNFPASGAITGTPRWDDAAIYAKKVIDSGYKLTPIFRQLFMADNAGTIDGSTINKAPEEIIFPIAADGIQTKSWGGSLFLIASTHINLTGITPNWGTKENWGGNRARATLVKKFFPNAPAGLFTSNKSDLTTISGGLKDSRALFNGSADFGLNITSISEFKQGYSVIKFTNVRADGKPSNDTQFADMDIPFMRAAEAYLTYAEAVLRGGAVVNGYDALTAFNEIRKRANPATVKTSIDLPMILDEKCREFFFEGQRRTDLIRFDKFGGATGYNWDWKGGTAAGTNFKVEFNLFPLPAGDLNANPNLDQNNGY